MDRFYDCPLVRRHRMNILQWQRLKNSLSVTHIWPTSVFSVFQVAHSSPVSQSSELRSTKLMHYVRQGHKAAYKTVSAIAATDATVIRYLYLVYFGLQLFKPTGTCSRHPSVSGDNGFCRVCQLGLHKLKLKNVYNNIK